jgi:hypothetical protein
MVELHGQWEDPNLRRLVYIGWTWLLGGFLLGSRAFLGAEVDDAQGGSWRRCYMVLALLGC